MTVIIGHNFKHIFFILLFFLSLIIFTPVILLHSPSHSQIRFAVSNFYCPSSLDAKLLKHRKESALQHSAVFLDDIAAAEAIQKFTCKCDKISRVTLISICFGLVTACLINRLIYLIAFLIGFIYGLIMGSKFKIYKPSPSRGISVMVEERGWFMKCAYVGEASAYGLMKLYGGNRIIIAVIGVVTSSLIGCIIWPSF